MTLFVHIERWTCPYILSNISDVEDLTHKTGNFKQFSIFVSMLESAIKQVGI